MTRSLIWAMGIVGGTLAGVVGAKLGWWVLAGPAVLAAAAILADVARSRHRPSWGAWILGGAFVLSGAIVAFADPGSVAAMIPILGAAGWATPSRCAG